MSRILIPCLDFPPTRGGIQSYLVEIFGRLASRHEIRVLAPTTGDDETGAAVVDLEVHRPSATWRRWIPGRSLADVIGLTGLIATECKSWRPDILICGHPRLAPSCAVAGRVFRRPVIGLTYGMELTCGKGLPLIHMALRHLDRVVYISAFSQNILIDSGVDPASLYQVRPGVDPVRFNVPDVSAGSEPRSDPENQRARGRAHSPIHLLTVARLDAREGYKSQDRVITALKSLEEDLPDLHYTIVGEGSDIPRLKSLAVELEVAARVAFTGRVSDEKLLDLYRSADIFVMVSRNIQDDDGRKFEGFGIVFAEASACGVPVIGGRTGGIPDAVRDGETGILVDPDDQDALVAAIRDLATNQNLARRMGQAGRRLVCEELNWDRAARDMEVALSGLL